jgi:ABC-2 type transport system permease protein
VITAAIWKDIQLLLRDRGTLISLFVLPIVFMLAFGMMFGSAGAGRASDEPRAIAIWFAPGQAQGEAISYALAATPGFVPQPLASAEAVRAAVAAGDVQAGLIVPADVAPRAGRPVELAIDLATPIQVRAPIVGALTAIVTRVLDPAAASAVVYVAPRSPPGVAKPLADISSFQITVPGNAVLFGFYIALTVAMSFAGERKTGTWRRLLAAPVPRSKVLLATLVPYYVIGCLQLAVLFGIGATVFGMRVAGSVPALVVLSMCVVLCAVSLGLLFASLGGTEKQLGSVGSVVLLVMGLLGGCMFPRLLMPAAMRSVGHAVPHSWALDAYYDLLVRAGTSVADIAPSLAALLGFAVAFAALGLARFRFE